MSPIEPVDAAQPPRLIGLVVVHGIGEPTAGEALADFTDSLQAARLAHFDSQQHVKRLLENTDSKRARNDFFPAHMQHGATLGGVPIVAAEVYWGSASQLAPGRLGVLHGIVSLMLNVPASEKADSSERSRRSLGLHRCCWLDQHSR